MKIKYILFYVNDISAALLFYKDILRFKQTGIVMLHDGKEAFLLNSEDQDIPICLAPREPGQGDKNAIVLSTENSLKEYNAIRKKGMTLLSPPNYGPNGLTVKIHDPGDNLFVLLEERDYSEK